MVKIPSANAGDIRNVGSLGQEHPLEKGMAPTTVFLLGKSYGQRSLVGHRLQRVRQD